MMIPHLFNGQVINQAQEDLQIGKYFIPKGYVNLTEMCKAGSKKISHYKSLKDTKAYIEAIASDTGLTASHLLVEIEASGQSGLQGTWGHVHIAIDLASWISIPFRVWANKVLFAVLNNEFAPLTEEARQAQEELQKVWQQLRGYTKETFWFMTDSIQAYYDRHPRVEKYQGQNYAEVFDTLNVGLFGMKSQEIKAELGIGKNKLNRDHFGNQSLKRIEMIQRIAEAQVTHCDMKPCDAVRWAIAKMHYGTIDFQE